MGTLQRSLPDDPSLTYRTQQHASVEQHLALDKLAMLVIFANAVHNSAALAQGQLLNNANSNQIPVHVLLRTFPETCAA